MLTLAMILQTPAELRQMTVDQVRQRTAISQFCFLPNMSQGYDLYIPRSENLADITLKPTKMGLEPLFEMGKFVSSTIDARPDEVVHHIELEGRSEGRPARLKIDRFAYPSKPQSTRVYLKVGDQQEQQLTCVVTPPPPRVTK